MVSVKWKPKELESVREIKKFNRSKILNNLKIRDNIRRFNFTINHNCSNQELFDSFSKELDHLIIKYKLIDKK
jgi:hypothetical protein